MDLQTPLFLFYFFLLWELVLELFQLLVKILALRKSIGWKKFWKRVFLFLLAILLIINSIVIFNKQFILRLFTNDLEVLNYANNYLLLTTIGTFGYGLQQVFLGDLLGLAGQKLQWLLFFIRLWLIRLPVVFIFQYFGIMENSLGYAFIISNYLAIIILIALLALVIGLSLF